MERIKHLSKPSDDCVDSLCDRSILEGIMGPDGSLFAVFSHGSDSRYHGYGVRNIRVHKKLIHFKALKNSWWRFTLNGPQEKHLTKLLRSCLQLFKHRNVESIVGPSRRWVCDVISMKNMLMIQVRRWSLSLLAIKHSTLRFKCDCLGFVNNQSEKQ